MARIKLGSPDEKPTFESAMSHLDQIVRKLEGNTLGLDAALEEYAKAVEYVRFCQTELSGARRKIEKLRGITSRGEAITDSWEEDDDEDPESDK